MKKTIIMYGLGLFLLLAVTGGVLSTAVDNLFILVLVLFIQYIILMLLVTYFLDRYAKPVQKAIDTVSQLLNGNFRARVHHPANGLVSELNQNINKLARNLSELSLQEQIQSEQLMTVVDNTVSGLVLLDEKGYIHLVNRKFLSMFGQSSDYYRGYLYYDVLDNEVIHETVQNTFLYEKNVKNAFVKKNEDDSMDMEVVGAPIFNERKFVKGVVLVFYDITELKKLERMRKDFVANVSHELKTPITSINGFSETLLDGAKNDPEVLTEFLQIIFKESKRLQLLIEDLLTLSMLEKDDFHPVINEVDLTQIIEDINPMIKRKADMKNISYKKQTEDQLSLMGNSEQVKQMIINLLDNAIAYTPEYGNITLFVTEKDEGIVISVTDTGIGISKAQMERVFERFYRVDKARSRNTGGTGLGLAIVKHIVEVHNGQIHIDSEEQKGTTVSVLLPKQSD
ncbi:Histidine kinase [Lentibacillus sp. JNUCC-1]|uniref:two-component system histidine kinase PnpS n=1 Tax=Lentibacillus sp. JNUCC-1 TaxID=2654513 RepID=UPI0012E7DDF3|nr:ATP-binding protein [Lentibacillus sp. JNUCC-1]MUV39347.1 Histidine kinase [Lentibacillus sp. JNUCC-1]